MFLSDYISGKKPLWRAFLYFAVLAPLAMYVIISTFYNHVANYLLHWSVSWRVVVGILDIFAVLAFCVSVFGLLSVWRCAANSKSRIWMWLAMLFVVAAVGLSINPWVLAIHTTKANVMKQTLQALSCWLFIALLLVLVSWCYFGAKNNVVKNRIAPIMMTLIIFGQLLVITIYRPLPTEFLMGSSGDLQVHYNFNYLNVKKLTANSMLAEMSGLEAAAQHGDADAAYKLGSLYTDLQNPAFNNNEAVRWLRYAIDHGVVFAKNDLANLYLQGRGVERNEKAALSLYQQGSAAGDDTATYNLGLMYETGSGTKQDYALAAKYYQRAVERTSENPDAGCAENDLGALYALGKGVKQSDVEARNLFTLAAKKDFIIVLPENNIDMSIPKDMDFPNVYAAYRLAEVKHQAQETTGLSKDEIKLAKLVANRYQSRCRD